MIWGVGTGRCGTKSLARELRGSHEPEPRFWGEVQRTYEGDLAPASDLIRGRFELDTPAVVDHRQSFSIPVIRHFDPDAHVIWLIRDPFTYVISSVARGIYSGRKARWEETRLKPVGGWNETDDIYSKNAWRWHAYNSRILSDLVHTPVQAEIRYTNTLHEHVNKGKGHTRLTLQQTHMIDSVCGPLWDEVRKLG